MYGSDQAASIEESGLRELVINCEKNFQISMEMQKKIL